MNKLIDKFTKGNDKSFSPYEEIKLDERDLNALASIASNSDIIEKLNKITEYQLALKVADGQMSVEAFKGVKTYGQYLKTYLKN